VTIRFPVNPDGDRLITAAILPGLPHIHLDLMRQFEAFGHSIPPAASLTERLAWLMQINFNGLLPVMDNEV
jgi:hypothetical protein